MNDTSKAFQTSRMSESQKGKDDEMMMKLKQTILKKLDEGNNSLTSKVLVMLGKQVQTKDVNKFKLALNNNQTISDSRFTLLTKSQEKRSENSESMIKTMEAFGSHR